MVSSTTYEELPCELKTCILSRLAVKDLLRFRCVSKPWRALIEDPDFVKKHLQRSIDESENSDNPSLLLSIERKEVSISNDLYKVDVFLGMQKCNKVKMDDHTLPFSCIYYIIGACDGLLCVSRIGFREIIISIWNLSTRESHDLLPDGPNEGSRLENVYGFGYDRISDDYKVIHIVRSYAVMIKIYSLKTKSWTKISSDDSFPIMVGNQDGTFARSSNSIYWLFMNRKDPDQFLIGRFDLGDENRFVEVEQPMYKNDDEISRMTIGALGGCLCLYSCSSSSTDIWVMKDDNKSWTNLISIPTLTVDWCWEPMPLVYSRRRNQILVTDFFARGLTWYDLNTKKLKYQNLVYETEIVMTESLVRINNAT